MTFGRHESPEQIQRACPVYDTRVLAQHVLGGLAWCETFVGVGLHCFWVLSKSSPLGVDNAWGALLALMPFVVML
jgi:hypothetical protein